eukprot:jgi/Chlat1/2059/Chrsp17S00161
MENPFAIFKNLAPVVSVCVMVYGLAFGWSRLDAKLTTLHTALTALDSTVTIMQNDAKESRKEILKAIDSNVIETIGVLKGVLLLKDIREVQCSMNC